MLTVVLLSLLLHQIAADRPDLPNDFSGKVVLTSSFIGSVPGVIYYDYDVMQSYRTDLVMFGQTIIDIYRYDVDPPTHYSISNGECQVEALSDEMYPMAIPPFARYQGDVAVNGKSTQLWAADIAGVQTSWYVFNSTDASSKVSWTLVRYLVATPAGNLQFDFSNMKYGPQNDTLFDPLQFQCPSPNPPVSYGVSGYVKSATTLQPIVNAQVQLGSQTTKADANGLFAFSGVVPAGYSLTASAAGYITTTRKLNVSSDILPGSSADLVLSPRLDPNQYRVVLTWGSSPPDLDSHAKTPCGCECYFNNRHCRCGTQAVDLDVDATRGWGPETITLSSVSSGIYTYYVYIFTTYASFVGSNALVQVYDSTGNRYSLSVPQTGYNVAWRYWKVFQLDGATGSFTIFNTVVSSV